MLPLRWQFKLAPFISHIHEKSQLSEFKIKKKKITPNLMSCLSDIASYLNSAYKCNIKKARCIYDTFYGLYILWMISTSLRVDKMLNKTHYLS